MADYRIIVRDGEKTTKMLLSEATPAQISSMISITPILKDETTIKNP